MNYTMNTIETVDMNESVIGPGGVIMTRKEYLEWLESERDS